MKQTIPFVKDIKFKSKIHEITSISLEHNLKMENNDSITGTFILSGKYKMNIVSVNVDEFEEKIDFDITLDDKYDSSNVKIDIDNFYYEIVNEEIMRVHIDVLVDNLEYVKKVDRCIEDENIVSIPEEKAEKKEVIDEVKNNDNSNDISKEDISITNISNNFLSSEEKYTTYKVHIIRDNENIDVIKEKYKVPKEELEKYNDLNNIVLGSKIIVPLIEENE